MFNFTSLLGARSSSSASQSILDLKGGVRVLVDVGWDESFDESLLKELEKQVPTISLILLTHATVAHIGAFAHCCKHVPLFSSIPVYATTPVISLGRALTQDIYKSTPLAASIIPQSSLAESAYAFPALWGRADLNLLRQPPRPEEIATYFSLIHPLKYSQPHEPLASSFSPPLNGLTITAYNAGHTLGGTIWHISHGLESLVYAVDWNQATEHVLSRAAWLDSSGSAVIDGLRRPTALICSTKASQRATLGGGRAKRDELLLQHIRKAVEQDGTVLVPSDSSARVLELIYLLEEAWSQESTSAAGAQSLNRAGLYFACTSGGITLRYAKSMLEWMEEGLSHNAGASEGRNANQDKGVRAAFDLKFVKIVERKAQLNRILSQQGPKVIIASDATFEWGFSRTLIDSIAQDGRNLVILTERLGHPTATSNVGGVLWDLWLKQSGASNASEITEQQMAAVQPGGGHELSLRTVSTESIEGDELAAYQQFLARQRQLRSNLSTEKGTQLESAADAVDDRSSTTSESSEESDTEYQGRALNVSATLSHARNKLGLSDAELGVDVLIRRKGQHDYDVQGKKGRERSFPVLPIKRNVRTDDFGDVIRPEDYLRAEEREEADGDETQGNTGRSQTAVGQKRKWADVAAKPVSAQKKAAHDGALLSPLGQPGRDGLQDHDMGFSTTNGHDAQMFDEEDAEDEDEAPVEGPQKAIITEQTLKLEAGLAYVDFCGLHDQRTLQTLIPLIRPKKLILTSGNEEETEAVAAECDKALNADERETSKTEVLTPENNTTIDASVDTSAWILRASRPFAKHIQWQPVKGLGVVALTGSMAAVDLEDDEIAKKKVKTSNGKGEEAPSRDDVQDSDAVRIPVIDNLPSNLASAARITTQSFHVGDLRLAELRRLMQSSGFAAEFRGEGTLLINGMVAVRKGGTGRLEVEGILDLPTLGGPDPTFFDVRRKVYEGLAVIAGG